MAHGRLIECDEQTLVLGEVFAEDIAARDVDRTGCALRGRGSDRDVADGEVALGAQVERDVVRADVYDAVVQVRGAGRIEH